MKIGIDASRIATAERSGTENYSLNIIKALAKIDQENYYQLYFNQTPEFFEITQPNFASKVIPAKRLWTQARLAAELSLNPVDLLFVPAHTIPVLRRVDLKTVVTVHDLGAEYLAAYHKFPDKIYLNWSTAFVARFATNLIADSKATKKDLIKRYSVPEKKIEVVYLGVDTDFFQPKNEQEVDIVRKKYGLNRPYLLFIGTIQPRKNLENLIEAFSQAQLDLDLVIAGRPGWLYKDIFEAPEKFGVEDKVKFLGFVPNEDLPQLYSGATAFVFPSLFEGFGLPVLEAFACGCPVLTSNLSSLPEIASEAAVLIDPNNVASIKDGLEKITKDNSLRSELIQKGQERVKKFTWEQAARQTLAVFERTLQGAQK